MGRDWEATAALADIETRMALFGENIAEFPLALTRERRGETLLWVVLIHVRVKGVTEFEIEAEAETLSKALRAAYLALNNRESILERTRQSYAAFRLSF